MIIGQQPFAHPYREEPISTSNTLNTGPIPIFFTPVLPSRSLRVAVSMTYQFDSICTPSLTSESIGVECSQRMCDMWERQVDCRHTCMGYACVPRFLVEFTCQRVAFSIPMLLLGVVSWRGELVPDGGGGGWWRRKCVWGRGGRFNFFRLPYEDRIHVLFRCIMTKAKRYRAIFFRQSASKQKEAILGNRLFWIESCYYALNLGPRTLCVYSMGQPCPRSFLSDGPDS